MAKKLLGERQIGDVVYEKGQILSDEDFAKSGLSESDVQTVNTSASASAPAQETAAAPADKDAEVDAQASANTEEKKEGEQSAPSGSEASTENASAGGSGEGGASSSETAQPETVEHVLTEQDLADNPELAAQGHKVGDTVLVPKTQVQQ